MDGKVQKPEWLGSGQIIVAVIFVVVCWFVLPRYKTTTPSGWIVLTLIWTANYFFFFFYLPYRMEYWLVPHDERPGILRYSAEHSRNWTLKMLWFYILLGLFVSYINRKDDTMNPVLKKDDTLLWTSAAYIATPPARGDIVYIRLTGGELATERVIGLPGEIVGASEGLITIDGISLAEPYTTNTMRLSSTFGLLMTPPRKLAADEYLVLPDDRSSIDERKIIVRRKDIAGKVFMRLFPLDKIGVLPAVKYASALSENSYRNSAALNVLQPASASRELADFYG